MSIAFPWRPLSARVVGYPAEYEVQDETQLAALDESQLPEHPVVQESWYNFRRFLGAQGKTSRSPMIVNADSCYQALRNEDLELDYTENKRWTVFALNGDLQQHRRETANGGLVPVKASMEHAPYPNELPRLPRGGKYLIVRRGTPKILEIESVRRRLRELHGEVCLADVVFYDRGQPGESPAFWSLKGELGLRGRETIQFDNPNLVREAKP